MRKYTPRTIHTGRKDSMGRDIKVSAQQSEAPRNITPQATVDTVRKDFTSLPSRILAEDVMDMGKLAWHLQQGNVTANSHPDDPELKIYNYSRSFPWKNEWDHETLMARGLMIHHGSGEIIARPWKKFFNYKQDGAVELSMDTPVQVTDKKDGSLIIGYRDASGELTAATKGSYTSEMSQVAQELFDHYDTDSFPEGYTPLFEVIYPGNRVVVDYNGMRDVVLLGAVDIQTGKPIGPDDPLLAGWDGPRTEIFTSPTFSDALQLPPRPGMEGIVVRDTENGGMVKIKQQDYVDLHKTATELTPLKVWKYVKEGSLGENIGDIPDEFYKPIRQYIDKMEDHKQEIAREVDEQASEVMGSIGFRDWDGDTSSLTREERKTIAMSIKGMRVRGVDLVGWVLSPMGRDRQLLNQVRPDPGEKL